MKDLMGKLKGFNFKDFFLKNGEKVGMGVTALIVLVCLGITSWSGYEGTPQEMDEAAQKMENQLRSNVWPESKQADFVVVGAEQQIARLETPIDVGPYDYLVPMSPKLYAYRMPADEPEVLPPTKLHVSAGVFAMAENAPFEDPMAADGEETSAKPAKAEKSEKSRNAKEKGGNRSGTLPMMPAMRMGRRDDDDDDRRSNNPAAMMMGMMGMMPGGSMGGGSASKSRGVWYNVITGKVDRQKQVDLLRAALHTDTAAEAAEFLEYYEFKVERQRAVPGENPWTGEWKELNTKLSMDVLQDEAAYFDADLVPTENISQIFTSPLPGRLDLDWEFEEVGHPDFPKLDDAEKEYEAAQSAAALALIGDAEDGAPAGPGGFSRMQRDASSLRMQANSMEGGARMGDMMEKYMTGRGKSAPGRMPGMGNPDPSAMYRGNPGAMGAAGRGMPPGAAMGMGMGMGMGMRPGAPGMGAAMGASGNPAMMYGAMPGMGAMGGMYPGMGGMGGTGPNALLFRFFDFEVEPGECYRYRVQLVIRNPSFEETFVSTPEVANGETRTSKWSEPSPPGAVPKDIEYALVKVQKRAGRREGANLSIVQVDTAVGTLISDTLPLTYGQYVGGTKKSTHLNIAIPSLDEEDVTFNSKEILVDSIAAPPLSATAIQDLGLVGRTAQKLLDGGQLDQAVTLNRFGELVALDADSHGEIEPSLKRYKEQNEEYKDLKDAASGASPVGAGGPDEYMEMMKNMGKGGKKGPKVQNPMRTMPGMMPGMPMMPGMAPEDGRGKKSGGRRN